MNVVNSDVASSLNQTRVSDRSATFVLASVAKALGLDPSQLALNEEWARRQHQEKAAHVLQEAFDVDRPTGPLTIHWEGKIQPALTGSEHKQLLFFNLKNDDWHLKAPLSSCVLKRRYISLQNE